MSERGARQWSMRGAALPAALTAQILTTGFCGSRCRCSGTSPNCGGSPSSWLVDRQSAAAAAAATGGTATSKSLMEEEVTEPDPQASAPAGMPPPAGTHAEVNGDLPGNPYLRDVVVVDVTASPAREPIVLQDAAEYSQQSQRCG